MGFNRSAAFGIALAAGTASQALAVLTGDGLVLTASNAQGTGQYIVTQAMMTNVGLDYDFFFFDQTTPIQVMSGPNVIAEIRGLSISYWGDNQIFIDYNVVGGASTTTFTLESGVLSFASLLNPTADADYGVSLTDENSNGAAYGASAFGPFTRRAFYNGTSVFADQLVGFGAGVNGTNTLDHNGSHTLIAGVVSSIETDFSFTVSAGDNAGGTSRYEIIPTPGTLALVGLGGLVMGRRRR